MGHWQKAHPEVACGLKRGFTFYHHNLDRPEDIPSRSRHQLLVAASPHDEIADTHWYRADFDHLLVREAQKLGVDYLDETSLTAITESETEIKLEGTRNRVSSPSPQSSSSTPQAHAVFYTGHSISAKQNSPTSLARKPSTATSQESARSQPVLQPSTDNRRTLQTTPQSITSSKADGSGSSNSTTASPAQASQQQTPPPHDGTCAKGAAAWDRVLEDIPALRNQFANAKPEQPFRHIPRLVVPQRRHRRKTMGTPALSRRLRRPTALHRLPSHAARRRPPGQHHRAPLGLTRISQTTSKPTPPQTDADLLAAARLIGSLYANMNNFPVFASLSLLYFAAVSFSETARRLGKPATRAILPPARPPPLRPSLSSPLRTRPTDPNPSGIHTAIARHPPNHRTLQHSRPRQPHRRNWYPVDPQDLIDSRPQTRTQPPRTSSSSSNAAASNLKTALPLITCQAPTVEIIP